MHEYFQMSTAAAVAYVLYCVVCLGYAVFVLAACLVSRQYRDRVHRGTWLHIAEGWALVAVLWAACAWGGYALRQSEGSWAGLAPLPRSVGVPSIALWVLLPPAVATVVVMAITTVVRAWRPASDRQRP
jgi:hypothetical protein